MKLIKIILTLLVVAVLVAVVFVSVFDANEYKPEIIKQVKKATGRDLVIDGDISFTLYPWIGLKLEKTALGNAPGFSQKNFASLEQLNVKVNVLPLLEKQIEINKIQLQGLRLALEVDENGRSNWEDLAKNKANEDKSATAKLPSKEEKHPSTLALESLNVEGFEFVDAEILYTDRSADMAASVSKLNVVTGAIGFEQPVDLRITAHVIQKNNKQRKVQLDSQIEMTTQLTFDRDFSIFDFKDLMLGIDMKANDSVAQDVNLKLATQAGVRLKDQQIKLASMTVDVLGVSAQADVTVSQFSTEPEIQGKLKVTPFDARQVSKNLGINLPPMANNKALASVGLSSGLKMKAQKLDFDALRIQLDNSIITGYVHVLDLARQQISYKLVLDKIDINHYLPAVAAKPAAAEGDGVATRTPGSATITGDEKIELPLDVLRSLNVHGLFAANAIHVKDYDISDLSFVLKTRDGVISADPFSFNVLDGSVNATANINVSTKPLYSVRMKAIDVQAGPVANPFLKGLMGDEDLSLRGAVKLGLDIRTKGETLNSLKQNAKGKVIFDMNETAVSGFDPEYYIRNSIGDYLKIKGLGSGDSVRGNYQPRKVTVFNTIHDTATINDGMVNTKDFLMDSERVTIRAKGDIDIMKNSVDMNASLKLARNKTVVEKILNEPLYVNVFGPFEKIDYKLDTGKLSNNLNSLARQEAEQRLAEEKAKLKEKADAEKQRLKEKADKEKQRLQDRLKNKLKDLF